MCYLRVIHRSILIEDLLLVIGCNAHPRPWWMNQFRQSRFWTGIVWTSWHWPTKVASFLSRFIQWYTICCVDVIEMQRGQALQSTTLGCKSEQRWVLGKAQFLHLSSGYISSLISKWTLCHHVSPGSSVANWVRILASWIFDFGQII